MTTVWLASSIINEHEMDVAMGTVQHINIQSICRCMTEGHNTDIIMLNCVTPFLFFFTNMKIFVFHRVLVNYDKDHHYHHH